MESEEKTLEERKKLLAQQVQQAVARGARVESQSDTMAVVIYGKPVNHILHFLIGLVTVGAWWIVWLILAISGGEKRQMITVDDFGNVLVQRA
jgi:hypothetical protein